MSNSTLLLVGLGALYLLSKQSSAPASPVPPPVPQTPGQKAGTWLGGEIDQGINYLRNLL